MTTRAMRELSNVRRDGVHLLFKWSRAIDVATCDVLRRNQLCQLWWDLYLGAITD